MTQAHFIAGYFVGFFSFAALWLGAIAAASYYKTIGNP